MSSPTRQASPSATRRTDGQRGDDLADTDSDGETRDRATRGYLRFGAMILVSTTVMFGVMYAMWQDVAGGGPQHAGTPPAAHVEA